MQFWVGLFLFGFFKCNQMLLEIPTLWFPWCDLKHRPEGIPKVLWCSSHWPMPHMDRRAVGPLCVFISSSCKINKTATRFKSGHSLAMGFDAFSVCSQALIHHSCIRVFHHRNTVCSSSIFPAVTQQWVIALFFFSLNAYMHMISKIRRDGKRLVPGYAVFLLRGSSSERSGSVIVTRLPLVVFVFTGARIQSISSTWNEISSYD